MRPSSQGHYCKVSTPLTFVMRLYKCCGKEPDFHASIIFIMGCLSSCPGPLLLKFLSLDMIPFFPSSQVQKWKDSCSLSLRTWMIFSGALSHWDIWFSRARDIFPFIFLVSPSQHLLAHYCPQAEARSLRAALQKEELQENAAVQEEGGMRGVGGVMNLRKKADLGIIWS